MAFAARLKNEENFLKEFDELSKKYKSVDLGLGFPNYMPPEFVTNALSEVLSSSCVEDHQYTNPNGHPRLTSAFSKMYSELLGRNLNPDKELLITAGSSEALFCAIMGTVSPGDEVIIFEPFFPVFVSLVTLARGVPKIISLTMSDDIEGINTTSANCKFDQLQLRELFSAKTKAIILNTPHNPTGKVFNIEELTVIANLCKRWDVICIADEVYERMVFKPRTHIRIATLPGMFERTITIAAAEKSFGVTGWQIGYAYGAEDLIKNLQLLHQYTVFNASTPLQVAFAKMFEDEYSKMNQPNSYFEYLEQELREKRDFVVEILKKSNFNPVIPEGGMYVMSDISELVPETDLSENNCEFLDQKFVKRLIQQHSLQAFPVSVFCSEKNKKNFENYIRFCFVKTKSTLDQAADILMNFLEVERKNKNQPGATNINLYNI